jgi:hypothetical protein
VAATNVPRPTIEAPGSSPHDVRPLHGGASFYGFPSFGDKPGGSCCGVVCLKVSRS